MGRSQRDPTAASIFIKAVDLLWRDDSPPTSWACPPSLAAQSSSFSVPLLPHVLGAKGYHISKTHYGPLPSQSLAMQETFQDGRPEEGQQVHLPGHVGGEIGPKGCLSAPSSDRSNPSLLRLCPGGSSVSLLEVTLQPVHIVPWAFSRVLKPVKKELRSGV